MIDPVSAFAVATTAYKTISKAVAVGQDIENVTGQLGKWFTATADIRKAKDLNKRAPLFKKVFAAGSVEEEAMQTFLAKKKAEDMRNELKQLISFTRGPSAWQELLKTEADIRKKRQKAIYEQKERQRKFFEVTFIIFGVLIIVGLVSFFVWLIGNEKGLW